MDRPVAVITGATSGLGRVAALELAGRGYRVGVVARSRSKADALLGELRGKAADVRADVFHADLGLVAQARGVGEEIAARYPRLDVLVNNAGVHAFSQRVTVEGFAEMTAVNYLGPFVLTQTLTDTLLASGPARIVNVASEAARQATSVSPGPDLRSTEPYTRRESMALYGRTKLMTIMWTQELARRLASSEVTVNCCDPGFNTTGLGRDLPGAGVLRRVLEALSVGDPRKGAGIIVRLATSPALAHTTGGYFSVRDAAVLACPEPGRSERVQEELWAETVTLLSGLDAR
ncbi:SDR family NAD(P)-dependent oxidoreductase [Streptomyces liangshanensis]|uniref:SDR family NAD(P)-dependent oxidoreductase n=1 Tax=Streptomyces liangshanensis TaxID=2717324 RepID=UPI001FBACB6E|nr:SDR family NAD(P)-dependent oxidoreductase [Streptomyces liangshanensis]